VDSKTEVSDPNATFVGSNGLRRIIYNHTGGMDWNNLQYYDSYQKLALSMETPYGETDFIVNQFKGWFIPPATTRYKFYQYCDDWCRINLSNVPGDSTENVTELISQQSHTGYRNFYDATRSWDHNQ
jgi:hypothetical protein